MSVTVAYTVPLAGFSNPKYFATDTADDKGFDISGCAAYVASFTGTGVATVVHEQTNDPSGATGWFAVAGKATSGLTATMTSTGASGGTGYLFPSLGARARIRVTALTTGDIITQINLLSNVFDIASPSAASGVAAHDAVIAGNPVRIGARGVSANFTAVGSGDVVDLAATLVGAQVVRPYSIPELDWQSTGTKADTTDLVVKTAAGAGLKNYMTGLQYHNNSAVASDIVVKQGSTVIWTGRAPASMASPAVITFPTPLQSAANAALNVAMLTTATSTTINAQGFSAP